MNALADVKGYMEFWGWTDGGGPGAVKLTTDGDIVARHGDAIWIANVEEACVILDRIHKRILGQRSGDET